MKFLAIFSLLKKFLKKAEESILSSDDGSEPSLRRDITEPCNECTHKGLPRFHSVTCEQNHPLFLKADAGSSLYPVSTAISFKPIQKRQQRWIFGAVLDPRRRVTQKLNQSFLLVRAISLAIDPLFFYVLVYREEHACLYIDGTLGVVVTFLRTACDAVHVLHIWLQLRMSYVSKESLVLGRGCLVWDGREIALHYLRPGGGFLFDLFVLLPVPQITTWMVVPLMISRGYMGSVMTVFLITFLFQFTLKLLHLVFLAQRVRRVAGFVFGTVWWGFSLNMAAYLMAAHVAGACWYLLASQRVVGCLIDQCKEGGSSCNVERLGCAQLITYHNSRLLDRAASQGSNQTSLFVCFDSSSHQSYNYGIFLLALRLVIGHSWLIKILYPIFWGLMTLSSFGNALEPSDHSLEVFFSIVVITCGLLLFSLLIGNIQVFLHAITAKKEAMKLKARDLESWMRRRQLPPSLRRRVRRYERHHWAATHGVDEVEMVQGLPEELRRDIKQHLSLDLVRQVPLFEHMDNLVLENICERLKPHLYIKDEVIIREGDPVQRMLFIVRGHLLSTHNLINGSTSVCCLGPGNFCGDELLTWCLKRPFVERLPSSLGTLKSTDLTEAFGLEAQDLRFVTEHFRYKFVNHRLKRTARYYSSGWRIWAVVTIQLAWRRYQACKQQDPVDEATELPQINRATSRLSPIARSESKADRLRLYTAMFTSHKPQDH